MNKISSVKIAIGFIALLLIGYYGYQFVAGRMIDAKSFSVIEPGKVTLLGIDAGSNYKIIVSNEVAQLEYVPGGKLEAPDEGSEDEGDSSDKRRIPLKETVQSLQGNTDALSELVTEMNDDLRKDKADLTPTAPVWSAADIEKAIKGDADEQKKLVHDLNSNLDGTPPTFINISALYGGITVDLPVPVRVAVRGVPETLVAHVKIPYQAGFTKKVTKALADNPNVSLKPSVNDVRGYYLNEVQDIITGKDPKENVASVLEGMISPSIQKTYGEAAERVLSNTQVILNENYVDDASVVDTGTNTSGEPLYDLNLDLTGEGRDRLWKYSRHGVGDQLLLIVDGVAIAAPIVRHELAETTVTITQMKDKSLVDEAVDDIKAARTNSQTASTAPK